MLMRLMQRFQLQGAPPLLSAVEASERLAVLQFRVSVLLLVEPVVAVAYLVCRPRPRPFRLPLPLPHLDAPGEFVQVLVALFPASEACSLEMVRIAPG